MQTFRSCVKTIFARIFLDSVKLSIDFNTGMENRLVKSADVANGRMGLKFKSSPNHRKKHQKFRIQFKG